MKKLFTTESVMSGHPDKMCDMIADTILDAYLEQDKNSKVACEVAISSHQVLIMGEVTSNAVVDIESLVRKVIVDIGYNREELGFNGYTIPIQIQLNKQSQDIARGVDKEEVGAGDQGIMYGYATDETENFMPLVHNFANQLAYRLEIVRKKNIIDGLRPDGKVQITLEYEKEKVRVHTIIISAQHEEEKDLKLLKEELKKHVIDQVIPKELMDQETKIWVNPTGRFVIGGPVGDTGLTGRKLGVDTYGGLVKHGGGAFSGKDYTKVDRSAAYYARYVAKHIVASKLAHQCEIGVSYAIGVAKPIAISIDTFHTSTFEEEKLLQIIEKVFDFSPSNMIQELDLKNVSYKTTTMYSHFGKDDTPWEELKRLKEILKIM